MPLSPRTLVLDACTTTTFARVDRLDLLTTIPSIRVVIGRIASTEVRKEPAKSILAKAIRSADLSVEAIDLNSETEVAALAYFDRMVAFEGRGEAEVLALALSRGYGVASDEVAVCVAARAALPVLGPNACLMTTHLLRMAVGDGRLTLQDAVALFHRMDVAPGKLANLRRLGHTVEDLLGA